MHIEPFAHNTNAKDECKAEYESKSEIIKRAFSFSYLLQCQRMPSIMVKAARMTRTTPETSI